MKTKSLDLSNTYVTKVQRIDSLGRGMCLIEGNQVFVPKVLQSEVIKIKILEQKKGIYTAELIEIVERSDERVDSECTHYSNCFGCDYLHLTYQQELLLKEHSLKHALQFLHHKNFQQNILAPKSRFNYRNRVQFHYQLFPVPSIGFLVKTKNSLSIIPIQDCLLPQKEIQDFYKTFKENWVDQLPLNAPPHGHVEIYFQNNQIHLAWNKHYSHLGFTQVNDEANQLIREVLSPHFTTSRIALELFCGNGNLLQPFHQHLTVYGFDTLGTLPKPHHFIAADLYTESGFQLVKKIITKETFQDVILDPPRSGFNQLDKVIIQSLPERLFYISCWPSSMVRDLNLVFKIRPWKTMNVTLVDMFPGTKHFETVVVINW